MMARAVIRKPEIPCFVLNSQVRVTDWEQVRGTHQGQRQIPTPRSKAGHRTVLTNRAINAFFLAKQTPSTQDKPAFCSRDYC